MKSRAKRTKKNWKVDEQDEFPNDASNSCLVFIMRSVETLPPLILGAPTAEPINVYIYIWLISFDSFVWRIFFSFLLLKPLESEEVNVGRNCRL